MDEEAFEPQDGAALAHAITTRLSTLDADEQRVLRLRFGLDTGDALAPSAVAAELGLNTNSVRAIERRALKKLRAE
jgi:RNA polymerase primary sigma factor